MFRFRHFSKQLILLWVGLIAAVQITVYGLISAANERNARVHIRDNLQIGARVFHRALTDRIESLSSGASLMSGDYAIKPLLMRDPDAATLRSILASYSERVKAPIVGLFSPEGDQLALEGSTLTVEQLSPFRNLIEQASHQEREQVSGYAYLAERLHLIVVVPLYAPEPHVAAWFGLAYPIDTTFAQAIKDLTVLEVSFVSDHGPQGPQVLSTTLDAPHQAALAKALAEKGKSVPTPDELLLLSGEPYVTHRDVLPLTGGSVAQILLQRSLSEELAPSQALERTILLISLAALGLASLVASGLARGLSRPLRLLARHTEEVARGNYTEQVHLDRRDELGQLATSFNQMTAGLAERDRVRTLLGKVVSPEIATQLLKSDLVLGGEEREVTVLFCDLRDFTRLSEHLSPTELLSLLNRYLDRMSTAIEHHEGVIDKYIGDAIMALFGAPVAAANSASLALAAAREMNIALEKLNQELVAEGTPALAFGIGINTARVVAGNMGSHSRLNYTVVGDGVNLASRLQGLTRDPRYGATIIISEATLLAVAPSPEVRSLGEVTVKGKATAVKIYAVATESAPHLPPGP